MSVISREDAIAKIKDIPYVQEHPNIGLLFEEWLKSLPDADDGWIPVEERLPEEDHWLGGSGKQFSDNVLVSVINRDDEDEWVDISQTIDGNWTLELPRHCKITAWQPLPKPYQPKEDK